MIPEHDRRRVLQQLAARGTPMALAVLCAMLLALVITCLVGWLLR